jgi:hypothetical protein
LHGAGAFTETEWPQWLLHSVRTHTKCNDYEPEEKRQQGDQHRDEERGHSKNILAHNGSVVVAKVRREKALNSSGLNFTALQSALIPCSPDLR